MSTLDWTIVVLLNGSIVAFALLVVRRSDSSSDWFLGGRSLPWWIVGLSMFATAIDSSDLIADSGGTFQLGISYLVTSLVGTVLGWVLAAHWIVLPMYRAGMYTNAEYLEARFGPAARLISALVQVQYRMLVLGIIANTLYLTLSIVCGWQEWAWWAVIAIALVATVYTMLGGLRTVAITDALQSVVMSAAFVALFVIVWNHVGGYRGAQQRLAAHHAAVPQSQSPDELLHIGHDRIGREPTADLTPKEIDRRLLTGGDYDRSRQVIVRRTPAWMVALQFIIVGMAYAIVNHTQVMRMFAARSEWDLKMAANLAGAVLIVSSCISLSMGVLGRAIYPDPELMPLPETLRAADSIYPLLVRELCSSGLRGLIVAGILAGCFSTYDSIGSALSALLTRDVYARFIVKDRDDRHYLRVGRWLTPVIIFGSFAYVPYLGGGMLLFYLDLVGAFVVPLLTIYLMGTFTRVHRRSGTIGLLVGVFYGVVRLSAVPLAIERGVAILPPVMIDPVAGTLFSMLITAGTMVVVSLVLGREPRGRLIHEEAGGWLRRSQLEVRHVEPAAENSGDLIWPALLSLAVLAAGAVICFVLLW